ncbi:cobinamide adenolsyltransferase [Vibrio mexicanus]|uniref:PGAP1-like alpha/beta domain-containing protein n=1 Tax=Vibrio mexicanus TaxID=1004326 RepID=UPI00063CEA9F|nr:cobinamide adenolsyltransferase [Vibrio mexicanus]
MKIIILHGLYMHGMMMQPLSYLLQQKGYDTEVISYNTVEIDLENLFDKIDLAIDFEDTNVLVGHSLGGLMLKQYLKQRPVPVETAPHVVTLGSPLQGASIAMKIQELGFGAMLGNSPEHGLNSHADKWEAPQKLGSLAGTTPLGFHSLIVGTDEASDGTVTVDETKIEGMTDHIEVHATHTTMLHSDYVAMQIDHFIEHDRFYRNRHQRNDEPLK